MNMKSETMKIVNYCFVSLAALLMSVSCARIVGGDDHSSSDPEKGPLMDRKCVSSIDYRYTNTVPGYEDESIHYTLTYDYDDRNRVARIVEVKDDENNPDNSYICSHMFSYDDESYTDVTSYGKVVISTGGRSYYMNIDDGKVMRARSWDNSYTQGFTYDEDGNFVGVNTINGSVMVNVSLTYDDGLLIRHTGPRENEDVYDPDIYYPHRYPNDKTNVDFNMFLLKGDPSLAGDLCSLLVSLRMCGNFGNSCVEVGGRGQEPDLLPPATYYLPDPDFSQHQSGTMMMMNNGFWTAVYEFDADGCPVKISYDVVYDVVSFEYDEVADTSESFPYDPDLGEDGDDDKVWYRVIQKNYTETKTGEIRCPAVYTITYKE